MYRIPFRVPFPNVELPGQPIVSPVDTGGYDLMIAGLGFRLANSQQFPYTRQSDQYVAQRIDQSNELGEHSLTPLPWLKSQSSFHGGAGQLSYESSFSTDAVEHIRFDMSQNCDVWTPGQVTPLPDVGSFVLPDSGTVNWLQLYAGPVISGHQSLSVVGDKELLDMQFPQQKAVTGISPGYQPSTAPDFPFSIGTPTVTDTYHPTAGVDLFPAGATAMKFTVSATDGIYYYVAGQYTASATVHNFVGRRKLGVTTSNPLVSMMDWTGTAATGLGWVKSRLMLACGPSVYTLNVATTGVTTLPAPNYVHPVDQWVWSLFSYSPTSILVGGGIGAATNDNAFGSTIMKMDLDATGSTPVLTGGASVFDLPHDEALSAMTASWDSFLIIGTSKGVRVGTFDTYTGALKIGPLTAQSDVAVRALVPVDRFVYSSSQTQDDSVLGLTRVDMSQAIDQAGRQAWAPDMRLALGDPLRGQTLPTVASADVLLSGRMVFLANGGGIGTLSFQGPVPGTAEPAWLRTSRIRYDTTEPKLFKLGRVRGVLDSAQISVAVTAPYGNTAKAGVFGLTTTDPGEFRLIDGIWEWVQLTMTLIGASCQLNGWSTKALPQERRQRIIQVTVMCFQDETDRFGLDVTDPKLPRDRLLALEAVEQAGGEVDFVEFTNTGSVSYRAIIESSKFTETVPPNIDSDFGGYITVTLRTTET